jgi:hypothetical protein
VLTALIAALALSAPVPNPVRLSPHAWPGASEATHLMSRQSKLRAARALASNGHAPNPAIPKTPEPRWKEPPHSPIQHIETFSATISSISNSYFNPDEAYQQNKTLQRGMLLDPIIIEPLNTRIMNVALLDWSIKPEDEENEEQKTICDRLTWSVRKIPLFTKYREALLWATWYGRYAVKNNWVTDFHAPTNSPTLQLKSRPNMPNGWLPVHGDKLRICFEDQVRHSGLGEMVRAGGTHYPGFTSYGDEARIRWFDHEERDCYVFHTHQILDGDFFDPRSAGSVMGLGLRHRLWWAWYFKQNLQKAVHEFADRIGSGITVYYFDQDNPESYARVLEAAKTNGQGSILLVPRGPEGRTRGAGVERIEPSTAGVQFLLQLLSEYWGGQIKLTIAGQTLTSQTGSTGLGSNVGDKHAETKNQYQQYDAVNLDETITRDLLGPLCNYPIPWTHSWKPKFESAVMKPDPQEKSTAAQTFYGMGGEVAEDELREDLGLRKPRKGEKTLSKNNAMQPGQGPPTPGAGGPAAPMPEGGGAESDQDGQWLMDLVDDEGGGE